MVIPASPIRQEPADGRPPMGRGIAQVTPFPGAAPGPGSSPVYDPRTNAPAIPGVAAQTREQWLAQRTNTMLMQYLHGASMTDPEMASGAEGGTKWWGWYDPVTNPRGIPMPPPEYFGIAARDPKFEPDPALYEIFGQVAARQYERMGINLPSVPAVSTATQNVIADRDRQDSINATSNTNNQRDNETSRMNNAADNASRERIAGIQANADIHATDTKAQVDRESMQSNERVAALDRGEKARQFDASQRELGRQFDITTAEGRRQFNANTLVTLLDKGVQLAQHPVDWIGYQYYMANMGIPLNALNLSAVVNIAGAIPPSGPSAAGPVTGGVGTVFGEAPPPQVSAAGIEPAFVPVADAVARNPGGAVPELKDLSAPVKYQDWVTQAGSAGALEAKVAQGRLAEVAPILRSTGNPMADELIQSMHAAVAANPPRLGGLTPGPSPSATSPGGFAATLSPSGEGRLDEGSSPGEGNHEPGGFGVANGFTKADFTPGGSVTTGQWRYPPSPSADGEGTGVRGLAVMPPPALLQPGASWSSAASPDSPGGFATGGPDTAWPRPPATGGGAGAVAQTPAVGTGWGTPKGDILPLPQGEGRVRVNAAQDANSPTSNLPAPESAPGVMANASANGGTSAGTANSGVYTGPAAPAPNANANANPAAGVGGGTLQQLSQPSTVGQADNPLLRHLSDQLGLPYEQLASLLPPSLMSPAYSHDAIANSPVVQALQDPNRGLTTYRTDPVAGSKFGEIQAFGIPLNIRGGQDVNAQTFLGATDANRDMIQGAIEATGQNWPDVQKQMLRTSPLTGYDAGAFGRRRF